MAEPKELTIGERLLAVQTRLKAPKGQKNTFGNYAYRSCEDILEAVKPLLSEHGLLLRLWDEIELIGDRYYVKATANVELAEDNAKFEQATAFAREAESKKGMDEAQVTGSASSYARKYALNGLFNIDDTKDADTNEQREQSNNAPAVEKPELEEPSPKQLLMLKGVISQCHQFFETEEEYTAFKEQKLKEADTKAKASAVIRQLTEKIEAKKANAQHDESVNQARTI